MIVNDNWSIEKGEKMFSFDWTVQYYETDQMAIVHHSNYIRWFESARTAYLSAMGIPYDEMEAAGVISPVLSVNCQYRQMTRYGEVVTITPVLRSYNGVKYTVTYEVRNKETGVLNAVGETSHCFLKKDGTIVSLKKVLPETHEVLMGMVSTEKEA